MPRGRFPVVSLALNQLPVVSLALTPRLIAATPSGVEDTIAGFHSDQAHHQHDPGWGRSD